ncbi:MAG TPA: glucose-6-phosphate dehydrogenase, partial [Candidatus Limnocylindria bacterium]
MPAKEVTVTLANPLREGLRLARTPEPACLVIFGASGDLTARKLMPALYNLALQHLLPASFAVIGSARRQMTADAFRAELHAAVAEFSRTRPINEEVWATFARSIDYVATPDDRSYGELRDVLARIDSQIGANGNRLFYLATPPAAYEPIIRAIGAHRLRGEGGWSRVVVEKPYGHDLKSAMELTSVVQEVFREDEVFRIDHYLGKETVQNILAFRFANGLFEPIWNRRYIDHVQITAAESIGIEGRGAFYEQTGAIRDLVSTHMFQMMTFLAMEPPVSFEPNRLRDETVKVLRSAQLCHPSRLVRGQYERYRSEPGVADDSNVETFAAMQIEIDNWRWADVPFFLRTGKCMAAKSTEITLKF